jgi:hypothetical protein
MFINKIAAALVLTAATTLPSFALAAPSGAPAHCILKEHRVTKVQALHVTERHGRGSSERLVGAQVFVQAEPGLTAEWLQLSIQRHMAQMGASGMKHCSLDGKDVRVSVESAGAGFAVKITGKDATQAKEILRRARLLVG